MRAANLALSEGGWPLSREGWLEDGYRVPHPVDEIPVAPVVVETVAKRYADGRVLIHYHADIKRRGCADSEMLCAIFYCPAREMVFNLNFGMARREIDDVISFAERQQRCWQKPVLVDVVDVIEDGERVNLGPLASMARVEWLKPGDLGDPCWIDTAQIVPNDGSPVRRVLDAGETRVRVGSAPIECDKLPVETAKDSELPLVPTLLDKVKSRGFTFDAVVMDRSYDSEKIYVEVESRHARPIIPLRETPAVKAGKVAPPKCDHGTWTFAGSDAKRGASKWRCPTGECEPKSVWVKASRLHPLVPRETDRFKALYHQRGAVERQFGVLKGSPAAAGPQVGSRQAARRSDDPCDACFCSHPGRFGASRLKWLSDRGTDCVRLPQ